MNKSDAMNKLDAYLESRDADIEADAKEYAKEFNVSMEEARRDVRDAYIQGYCEGEEARRTGDWDFGRE
jgi:hypothetical protein